MTKHLQQGRIDSTLSIKRNYPEGIMTRRQWIELMKEQGATVQIGEKCPIRYNRTKYNRMNWQEQVKYEKRLEERVPCYELYPRAGDNTYFEITKTEYDYFNSLS